MKRAAVITIARICHEANRALCTAFGDNSQKPWDEAGQVQRDHTIETVQYALASGMDGEPDSGLPVKYLASCFVFRAIVAEMSRDDDAPGVP